MHAHEITAGSAAPALTSPGLSGARVLQPHAVDRAAEASPEDIYQTEPPVPTSELTNLFLAANGPLTPSELRASQRKVVSTISGFVAELYRATGGGYFDACSTYCESSVGMRVVPGNNGQLFNEEHNALLYYEHLMRATGPQDSIIVIAHSNGCQAALRVLIDPAYNAVWGRIHAFIPINGPFGGSPLASLSGPLLGALIGRCIGAVGGDADVMAKMSPESRAPYLKAHREDIQALATRMPVIPVTSTFRGPRSITDRTRLILWAPNLYMRFWLGKENDGAVPEDSQRLPGLDAVVLEDMSHGDTVDQTGPWPLDDVTRRLLKMALGMMSEEMRNAGQERSVAEITLDAPRIDQDYLTRMLRTFRESRDPAPGTDFYRARQMGRQALRGYAISGAAGVGAVLTLPLFLTGVPGVLFSASLVSNHYSNAVALRGLYCATRGAIAAF